MTNYEYGIDWKKRSRREETPHRSGMTREEAEAFLVNDAGDKFDWNDVFVIIRRPIGDWEDLPKIEDSEAAAFFAIHEKPQHTGPCRCIKAPSPDLFSNVIGKDCGPSQFNINLCACGSSAGINGYCGPNGCYNVPG